MAIGVVGRPLVRPYTCSGCDSFPCRCHLDRSVRIEPCICGDRIVVGDRSDQSATARAVSVHNSSTRHARAMFALGWR